MAKHLLLVILIFSSALFAGESERFITKVKIPSGETIVVEEGAFEARSIGSYSIRVYDAALPEDETTFFRTGLIHAREGAVEKVILADVAGDAQLEIIVTVRSVGTGNYISAQSFSIDKELLVLTNTVENLPPEANPVTALQELSK